MGQLTAEILTTVRRRGPPPKAFIIFKHLIVLDLKLSLNPWSKEDMEWKQWLKCVILYRSFIVYNGVEGEGRGCERLRLKK